MAEKQLWNNDVLEEDGIIVGCSKDQEWLLPWWWINFRIHNQHPVTFVNFGDMTEKAINWCKDRGQFRTLEIEENFLALKDEIEPGLAAVCEEMNPQVWTIRLHWQKKPFVLLQTPYRRTIWIDLDCQVRGSIQGLFEMCENNHGICMREEVESHTSYIRRKLIYENEKIYNAGVVIYKHGAQIIEKWAEWTLTKNRLFNGDSQLVSRIIYLDNIEFTSLPILYNWRTDMGINHHAVILHWIGNYKNIHVKEHILMLNKYFFIDLTLYT